MTSLPWNHAGILSGPIFDEVTYFDAVPKSVVEAPFLPKWVSDAFVKQALQPSTLMEYAKADAVAVKNMWQPTIEWHEDTQAVVTELPEVVYDKTGAPHTISKKMWHIAPPGLDHSIKTINENIAKYLAWKPLTTDERAATICNQWRYVVPLMGSPWKTPDHTSLDRKRVLWDFDLIADGDVLAAGDYTWWTGKMIKFWGLGFYRDKHGGQLLGAIQAKRYKSHWHGASTSMEFHFNEAIGLQLVTLL